ncbi:acyltransferase [bacterium]|nr:acyltransferase [bacterium]
MSVLRVAAIQTSPVFGDVSGNLERALALIPAGCDLAVLPELFATGYQFRDTAEAMSLAEETAPGRTGGPIIAALTRFAAESGCTLAAGLAERAGDRVFNSAVLVRPDGSRGLYRKVHLFADEKLVFTPGDLGFPVFKACGTTVGLMICFDWIFPEAARSLALAGASILLHPSNLLLPWCPEAMITRCQENRVFAVTSNRIGSENRTGTRLDFIGMSEVVSPLGRLLVRLGKEEEGAAVTDIDLAEIKQQVTPRNHIFGDRRPDQYRL